MSSLASRTVSTTRQPHQRRRWGLWLLGVAGALLALFVAYFAYVLVRMSYVPANLDYSTTRFSEAGLYRATYTTANASIPVNKLHTWTLHVETPDGQPIEDAEIAVNGDMPQHGHGMPTRPQVTQNLGNGDYLVEGMKFQMGGWWVIDFSITVRGQTDKVSFNLLLQK